MWIKDRNIRPKTLQLPPERAGNILDPIDISKDFLGRTQAAQQLRERMDKWGSMKLKSFCTTKKKWSLNGRMGTITRMYRELKKLISKKSMNQQGSGQLN
jgi:hypothetical protein